MRFSKLGKHVSGTLKRLSTVLLRLMARGFINYKQGGMKCVLNFMPWRPLQAILSLHNFAK
jgi:hypothetical protein